MKSAPSDLSASVESSTFETGDSLPVTPAAALEADLRRKLLAAMLESAPTLAVIFQQPEGKVAGMNASAIARLNPGERGDVSRITLPEMIGLSSVKRLQSEILPQVSVLGRWTGGCMLRDVWGSEFPVYAAFRTHRGNREHPAGFISLVATAALEFSTGDEPAATDHELLHALLETVPDAIYFKDRDSRFLRVSRAMALKNKNGEAADFIGKSDFDRFTSEHARPAYENEQKIIRTGEPILDLEEKETWADGRVTWVSTSKFPLCDSNGTIVGTFGISRDITAAKINEAARQEMETQLTLSQKMESIGRLAAGIAHEVNTPTQFIADNTHFLTNAFAQFETVIGRFRALREAASPHSDCAEAVQAVAAAEREAELDYLLGEIPRCLQQTLDGLSRVTRIVCSLKEFAHPNSPELAPADLNRVIETSLVVSRHEWKYVADVVSELDASLPLVPCVVDELNQVMLNLVINAAHAIGEAAKVRTAARGKITVRTRCEAPWAVIEVEDTGTGIPPEIRGRIFEPFFTTKAVGKGTGQGLAIVHTVVVKHHHGTIDVTTEPGKGTIFVVKIPLQQAAAAVAETPLS